MLIIYHQGTKKLTGRSSFSAKHVEKSILLATGLVTQLILAIYGVITDRSETNSLACSSSSATATATTIHMHKEGACDKFEIEELPQKPPPPILSATRLLPLTPQDGADRMKLPLSAEEQESWQTSTASRVTTNILSRLGIAWAVVLTRVLVRNSWVLFRDVSEILESDHLFSTLFEGVSQECIA
jgi:hypothetical protein